MHSQMILCNHLRTIMDEYYLGDGYFEETITQQELKEAVFQMFQEISTEDFSVEDFIENYVINDVFYMWVGSRR